MEVLKLMNRDKLSTLSTYRYGEAVHIEHNQPPDHNKQQSAAHGIIYF